MSAKKYILGLVAALMMVGCYEDFDTPAVDQTVTLTPTHTIAEFKAMFNERGGAFDITGDIVIAGKVTTSDETGNF